MLGFDPKWRDVLHFIIGVTREIWEDRNIASLRHRYAPGLIVRSPVSVVVDNSNVVAATMSTLAEFPDRELPAEDVISCEDPSRTTSASAAFLSSHRLICRATHGHPGVYGAPSGRRLCYRILADCAIGDDRIDDGWLVRDQTAIVRHPGGGPAFGDAADHFWMGLRAAFPKSTFAIDHVIGREDPLMPPRAALRWSLWGKHDGWGRFGRPRGPRCM